MSYLRSALYVLFLAVSVIPWATAVLLMLPFVSRRRYYWACVGWLRLAVWGARAICGVRHEIRGMENLPSAGDETASVLLASKHQSTWETFAYPTLMPHPLAYVFKKELLRVPFFGWAMAKMDMIHIDRSRRAEAWHKIAEQGRRLASQGVWVIMFPEGTRVARGQAGTYKLGAARLAIDTGVAIVPIAMASARCWPRKSFRLRPGTIPISIGRPIPSQGRDAASLMAEVEQWIEAEMRRLDPQAYGPAPPDGGSAA